MIPRMLCSHYSQSTSRDATAVLASSEARWYADEPDALGRLVGFEGSMRNFPSGMSLPEVLFGSLLLLRAVHQYLMKFWTLSLKI